jgi:hypothetical protein
VRRPRCALYNPCFAEKFVYGRVYYEVHFPNPRLPCPRPHRSPRVSANEVFCFFSGKVYCICIRFVLLWGRVDKNGECCVSGIRFNLATLRQAPVAARPSIYMTEAMHLTTSNPTQTWRKSWGYFNHSNSGRLEVRGSWTANRSRVVKKHKTCPCWYYRNLKAQHSKLDGVIDERRLNTEYSEPTDTDKNLPRPPLGRNRHGQSYGQTHPITESDGSAGPGLTGAPTMYSPKSTRSELKPQEIEAEND